jgi:acetyl-CoA carboxylase carboxyl transferase subunit beta
MGGSMGSVVGEKFSFNNMQLKRIDRYLLCFRWSSYARSILSLMQMAKISAALHVHQSCANLLYISVLTSPTTGGVTKFAMLGDLIFAEPKADWVCRTTLNKQEQLPDNFRRLNIYYIMV